MGNRLLFRGELTGGVAVGERGLLMEWLLARV